MCRKLHTALYSGITKLRNSCFLGKVYGPALCPDVVFGQDRGAAHSGVVSAKEEIHERKTAAVASWLRDGAALWKENFFSSGWRLLWTIVCVVPIWAEIGPCVTPGIGKRSRPVIAIPSPMKMVENVFVGYPPAVYPDVSGFRIRADYVSGYGGVQFLSREFESWVNNEARRESSQWIGNVGDRFSIRYKISASGHNRISAIRYLYNVECRRATSIGYCYGYTDCGQVGIVDWTLGYSEPSPLVDLELVNSGIQRSLCKLIAVVHRGLCSFLGPVHGASHPIHIVDSTPDLFRGLLPASLHFGERPTHDDKLLSRIAGIATIRYGDYRREKDQKLVPIAGRAPRLFKTLPLVHVLTFLSFILCVTMVSALILALIRGLPLLVLIFGILSFLSCSMFGIALDYLDRITLTP